jgi:type 1 glutamine amidotransferase
MYEAADEGATLLDEEQCSTIRRNLRAHEAFRTRTQGQILAFMATAKTAHPSGGMSALKKLGQDEGLWTVTEIATAARLPQLPSQSKPHYRNSALIFHSSGDSLSQLQRQGVIDFVNTGGGLVVIHGALDSQWRQFLAMVNGHLGPEFPSTFLAEIRVLDHRFPATKHLRARFNIVGQIANVDGFDPKQGRMLAQLPAQTPPVPILWANRYGAGRVFASNIGHDDSVFSQSDMQTMLLQGMSWALGYTDGDAGPPRSRFRFLGRFKP